MSDEHKRGKNKSEFCTARATSPCKGCGQAENYQEICKPADWATVFFWEKHNKGTYRKRVYEAHHMLPVSAVNDAIGESKATVQKTIGQVKWCINHKKNMIALPLWGHTIMHYCDIRKTGDQAADIGDVVRQKGKRAPKWKDLPQHDFDHNCTGGYTEEAKKAVKKVLTDVKVVAHKLQKPEKVAEALDDLSDDFREFLEDERGFRGPYGGTHGVWVRKAKNADPDWEHAYSMADDGFVTRKPQPRIWDDDVVDKVNELAGKLIASGN